MVCPLWVKSVPYRSRIQEYISLQVVETGYGQCRILFFPSAPVSLWFLPEKESVNIRHQWLQASIYYGMPALVKSTDTHEILEQITGDFEKMKEKYQVVIDEEEE